MNPVEVEKAREPGLVAKRNIALVRGDGARLWDAEGREYLDFVAAQRGFHGRTFGALSLTHKAEYREPFAPLVPGVQHVPYGDAEALKAAVTRDTAALVLEPIQ